MNDQHNVGLPELFIDSISLIMFRSSIVERWSIHLYWACLGCSLNQHQLCDFFLHQNYDDTAGIFFFYTCSKFQSIFYLFLCPKISKLFLWPKFQSIFIFFFHTYPKFQSIFHHFYTQNFRAFFIFFLPKISEHFSSFSIPKISEDFSSFSIPKISKHFSSFSIPKILKHFMGSIKIHCVCHIFSHKISVYI